MTTMFELNMEKYENGRCTSPWHIPLASKFTFNSILFLYLLSKVSPMSSSTKLMSTLMERFWALHTCPISKSRNLSPPKISQSQTTPISLFAFTSFQTFLKTKPKNLPSWSTSMPVGFALNPPSHFLTTAWSRDMSRDKNT